MRINGNHYKTVWYENGTVCMIEQNLLPFDFQIFRSETWQQTCIAIKTMIVRGAGAIGSTAGYAMLQAVEQAPADSYLPSISHARAEIEATRPTARNLFYAVEAVFEAALASVDEARKAAFRIAEKDEQDSLAIGRFGSELLRSGMHVATHCNAGALAFTDYGTALSPVYQAVEQGKDIFVFADETRPRAQGARLTAWELAQHGIRHTIIPDNATAYYMQQGKIDMMIVGADRIALNGDTANKIGTLEKAIAAHYYHIPFYVAAPLSTFDADCPSGCDIPIEFRSPDEVLYQQGPDEQGIMRNIRVASPGSGAENPAFDVTPASLISGIITEKGIISAETQAIRGVLSL